MKDRSTTLQIGDRAPEFLLKAANAPTTASSSVGVREYSLRKLLASGPLILEFLRGTW